MIFETGGMVLSPVREIFAGTANDVLVCQDISSPVRPFYVLVAVRDPSCAKKLLAALHGSEKPHGDGGCIDIFTQNQFLCLLYHYRGERRLDAFAEGQLAQPSQRERMAVNLVMECLSTPLPYPLLYLALTQRQINLMGDGGVTFSPYFDLGLLEPEKTEGDCANVCARLLLEHLDVDGQKKLKSFLLLRKKLDRAAYQSFPELYRDIRLTMTPDKKTGFVARVRHFWQSNRTRLFRVLLAVMGILIALALVMVISQLIFGDFVLFSLFENRFSRIGTESLG